MFRDGQSVEREVVEAKSLLEHFIDSLPRPLRRFLAGFSPSRPRVSIEVGDSSRGNLICIRGTTSSKRPVRAVWVMLEDRTDHTNRRYYTGSEFHPWSELWTRIQVAHNADAGIFDWQMELHEGEYAVRAWAYDSAYRAGESNSLSFSSPLLDHGAAVTP